MGRGGEAGRQVKTLEGSFSAVSKPNFATKYSFFSVFWDLQDFQSFAPLRTQFFFDFCKILQKLMIFPDFAKFCSKSVRISYFSLKFSRNFAGIAGICWKSIKNCWNFTNFLNFQGAKGRQAAKWKWPPLPSESGGPFKSTYERGAREPRGDVDLDEAAGSNAYDSPFGVTPIRKLNKIKTKIKSLKLNISSFFPATFLQNLKKSADFCKMHRLPAII